MIKYRVVQFLLLVSSITSQALIKGMVAEKKEIGEGIAQKIEELPKELRYKIFSNALELRENPKYEVYKKFGVGSRVAGIALNEDNTRALTGSNDNRARIWDVKNGKLLKELESHTKVITSVALSANGTLALTGSYDGTARVWNALTGELIRIIEAGSFVYSVALSADGKIALIGGFDGIARLYNTSTGELLKLLEGHSRLIKSVALSTDGGTALTGSNDGTARVWDILTGKSIILQANSLVISVALSADGTIALTGTNDEKALVWDTKTGAVLNTVVMARSIESVALSKDRKRALVITNDNKIQVWNTQPLPGKKETSTPLTVLEGHTESVKTVAFGGADFIASGSYDNTALIWKPFALEPQGPQENLEVLRQAYKETFSRPKFLFPDEK